MSGRLKRSAPGRVFRLDAAEWLAVAALRDAMAAAESNTLELAGVAG